MKKLSLFVLITITISFFGCAARPSPALSITGDCEGYSLTASISLEKAIAQAKPRAEQFDVLLMGSDGLTARISGGDLSGCELVYSDENAWELKSELHPPSARVKSLARVVVVSVSEDLGAVRLIGSGEVQTITAGQLFLAGTPTLKEEGISKLNGRSVTVFTTQYRIPLLEMLPREDRIYAVGFDGWAVFVEEYYKQDCVMQINGNGIGLLVNGHQVIEDLAGVMINPPDATIAQTSFDAMRFLEQGERVMVIELDGLGWEMLQRADAPYLQSLQPQRALAEYPPISPVGLASMITGANPDKHGIHDRENREIAVEDIFEKAKALGKTCAYIEGSHALLNTSLAPVLSLNDGDVLANAQKVLEGNPDLIFVHFHEIDEAAHEFGPYTEQTIEKIKVIDEYVRTLAEEFDGQVIITADHGLHETEEGGTHGIYSAEDMIVPYIINEK